MKPTVLHAADSKGHLCGFVNESSWAEKYIDDEFAQTLPPCQKCLTEIMNRGWEVPDMWKDTEWVQSSTKPDLTAMFQPEPLYVVQSNEILQSEEMSLREWCE